MGFKRIYFYILLVAVSVGYFYLVFTNYNENKHQTYDSAVLSQIKTVQKYKAIINERIEQQKRLLEETAKFVATKDYTQDYTTIKGVLSIVARTGSFLAVYAGYPDIRIATDLSQVTKSSRNIISQTALGLWLQKRV